MLLEPGAGTDGDLAELYYCAQVAPSKTYNEASRSMPSSSHDALILHQQCGTSWYLQCSAFRGIGQKLLTNQGMRG